MLDKSWILKHVYPYLKQSARMIDVYRFELLFELEPGIDLVEELNRMQNPDGGFWSCLEPDTRSKRSSIIGTCRALDYYLYVDLEEEPKKNLVSYLKNTFRKEQEKWSILSNDISDAPRAIWWNQDQEEQFSKINPTAEVVGFARYFSLDLDLDINRLRDHLLQTPTSNMHDYLALLKMERLFQEPLSSKLLNLGKELIEKDSSKWSEYCLSPLDVIDSVTHPLYEDYQDLISLELNMKCETLKQDLCLSPNWEWGQFEEAFEEAKRDWQGKRTVDFLERLDAFGGIQK